MIRKDTKSGLLSDPIIVNVIIRLLFAMMTAQRRLMIDLKNLKKEHPDGLDAEPDANSILNWHGTVRGPCGTQWEGEDLEVAFEFPESYPMDPPKVSFLKEIRHPNVFPDRQVCVDILQHNWDPENDVLSILISLQAFLASPNFRSVASPELTLISATDPRYYDLVASGELTCGIMGRCEIDDDEYDADTEELVRDRDGWVNSRMARLVELGIGSIIPMSLCSDAATLFELGMLNIICWTDWLTDIASYVLILTYAQCSSPPGAGPSDEHWREIQCMVVPLWVAVELTGEPTCIPFTRADWTGETAYVDGSQEAELFTERETF
jgi:ubiquitin-protein ligase